MGYASDGYEGGTMSDVADMGKNQSQPKNKIKTDPVVKRARDGDKLPTKPKADPLAEKQQSLFFLQI